MSFGGSQALATDAFNSDVSAPYSLDSSFHSALVSESGFGHAHAHEVASRSMQSLEGDGVAGYTLDEDAPENADGTGTISIDAVTAMLRPLFNSITHWAGNGSVVDRMLL